ncbi:GNAT family N-acetyltransferase [Agromyces sp. LHK192]|uniref:GNAT family N-acetyltransferase n=1 Tax=Agromyces sp. LHK192 TaxID=2498704 RepID=UPI000FD6BF85|nr:GNAT family N-acetyltransferase [Agromyces sp. LHK192]
MARRVNEMRDPLWTIEDRLPTPAEHRRLAEAVGWRDAFDWDSLPRSLAGSTFGVVAVVDAEAVGMARVVGDGVKYFAVQDVAVHPHYQGEGIGRDLVQRALDRIAVLAPSPAFVSLFSTREGADLYESLGFTRGDMTGMFQIVEPAGPGREGTP